MNHIEPKEFCRAVMGWDKLTPARVELLEEERGCKKQYINILLKYLPVDRRTIERCGTGLDFPKMPEAYKVTLYYALQYRSERQTRKMLEEKVKALAA